MAAPSILLGDDFSHDNKKARVRSELLENLAAEMARQMHADLKVLYALDVPSNVTEKDDILPLLMEDQARRFAVKAKVDFQEGSPVELILKKDHKKNGPELILLGSRGPAEQEALKIAKKLKANLVLAYSIGDQIRRLKDMLYSQRIVSQGGMICL